MYHWTMLRVYFEQELDCHTLRFPCLAIQAEAGVLYKCGSCLDIAVAWTCDGGGLRVRAECWLCHAKVYVEHERRINVPNALQFHRDAFAMGMTPLRDAEDAPAMTFANPSGLRLTAKDKRLLKAMKIEI